ncbi:hypothetical protein RSOLAG22IIIB_05164 [Rhizoctonia solani]|uniref:Uncharacterized protein n=1 Tax=Rhizoctonia solani TaxID=456999 RepID=A0A0K6G406_9AGAM|nr:hypothetical protein RSOLAG22IIIB_05164 [Rhizoctonia solani]
MGDKPVKFGSAKLPAYVPLAEDCQAIVVLVKNGWIPDLNVEWLKTWVFDFNYNIEERVDLEFVIKKSLCFKATKGLKAYFTLVDDKSNNNNLNKWELRLSGAKEGLILSMKHGEELKLAVATEDSPFEATIKAYDGCSVCWDGDSSPGNRHLTAKCPFLQKANAEQKKAGMESILIVDKTTVSTVGKRAKLPVESVKGCCKGLRLRGGAAVQELSAGAQEPSPFELKRDQRTAGSVCTYSGSLGGKCDLRHSLRSPGAIANRISAGA